MPKGPEQKPPAADLSRATVSEIIPTLVAGAFLLPLVAICGVTRAALGKLLTS